MRKPIVAGNWKMHKTVGETQELIHALGTGLSEFTTVESLICPPFTALAKASEYLEGTDISLGAQNLYWEEQGAFTGEISPRMIAELADYVIIGHSERRAIFQDTDQVVAKKLHAAIAADLKPILCIGETLEENEAGKTGDVLKRQLNTALEGMKEDQLKEMVIAYEPVWAIGTGKAATPEGANRVIKNYIRDELAGMISPDFSQKIRIQYGGSVKPDNAGDFFSQPEIDGALVGGASLKAEDFIAITKAAAEN